MKIDVDEEGWVVSQPISGEERAPSEAPKPGSGVYAKVTLPEARVTIPPTAAGALAESELGAIESADTEPSPPSDLANAIGSQRLPPPPSLPRDLLAEGPPSSRKAG